MKAFVTGGSGFIGSEIIRQLVAQGIEVRALLRKTSSRKNLEGVPFEPVDGDLLDIESLKRGVQGVDFVFHLAGMISARTREQYFLYNARGTSNLARAAAEVNAGLRRFVYVSSMAASGPADSRRPLIEHEPGLPVSAYGESKLGGERELLQYSEHGAKYPVTIVRPPVVYGPRDQGVFEFVKVVNAGFAPLFPSRDESGEKFYSIVYVEDLVKGILLAGITEKQERNELFFLAGDGVYSWSELLGTIAENLGRKPRKIRLPRLVWTGIATLGSAAGWLTRRTFALNLDKLNELAPDYWICSNQRARQVLGFDPRFDLKTGMANTIAWYKNNGWI